MMKLTCRTRGNSSPQGKSRVYYAAHPADIPAYAQGIFQDILKVQNCAIYYDEEPEAPWDRQQLFQQLEQMQLLVIPITSRFLYQPNRAREVEFPFAMEHRIPVLPLIQEKGLEPEFNRFCGDLQLLNRHDPDPTALPYEEKLEKFLASVLVGDTLAAQVRDAFDAYVFLSYRKKDRQYAQQLMRLIHKNQFCRDIAIWYDEFLTPGENFNQAIAQALEKSALFALTVTPSLIEAGNYVMRIEYPEAKKAGKLILPVEMAPTDRQKLEDCYQDLPPCAKGQDEPGLSSALLEAVQQLAIRENDGSPEHNFFIGLAYLNGIDVEVDRQRALELITGSAEAGLPEAMGQLARMHRSGDGVQRDRRQAAQWQNRLAQARQRQYQRTQGEEEGLAWAEALAGLGQDWLELADLARAGQAYRQAQQLCRQLVSASGSRAARQALAQVLQDQGQISLAEGQPRQAKEHYAQSLDLRRQLLNQQPEAKDRQRLAALYLRLGAAELEDGQDVSADGYYIQGMMLSQQVYEQEKTPEAKGVLARSYAAIGLSYHRKGKLAQAETYLLKSLPLLRQLAEETKAPETARELAGLYGQLALVSRQTAGPEQAREYGEQALELSRQLCRQTGLATDQKGLSQSHARLGDLYRLEGSRAQAEQHYQKSLELDRELWQLAQTPEAQKNLAESLTRLAQVRLEAGQEAQAEEGCLQALELARDLFARLPTPEARKALWGAYQCLGDLRKAQGRLTQAKEAYEKGLALYLQLFEREKSQPVKRDLAAGYRKLGDLARTEGKVEEAGQLYQRGLALLAPAKAAEHPFMKESRGALYESLAALHLAQKELAQAKDYFRRSVEQLAPLTEQTGSLQALRRLAGGYSTLSNLSDSEKDHLQALEYAQKSIEILSSLYRRQQTVPLGRDLAAVELQGAVALGKLGQNRQAVALLDQALELCGQLYSRTKSDKDYHQAASTCYYAGLLANWDRALQRERLSQARQLWQELVNSNPDSPVYLQCLQGVRRQLERLG